MPERSASTASSGAYGSDNSIRTVSGSTATTFVTAFNSLLRFDSGALR
jgi:hypothetical protein